SVGSSTAASSSYAVVVVGGESDFVRSPTRVGSRSGASSPRFGNEAVGAPPFEVDRGTSRSRDGHQYTAKKNTAKKTATNNTMKSIQSEVPILHRRVLWPYGPQQRSTT